MTSLNLLDFLRRLLSCRAAFGTFSIFPYILSFGGKQTNRSFAFDVARKLGVADFDTECDELVSFGGAHSAICLGACA